MSEPLLSAVLRVLVSLTRPGPTETEEQYATRMYEISLAIATESESRSSEGASEERRMLSISRAAELVAVGHHESHFAEWVGKDRCLRHPSRCDQGRARSYWQIWQVACPRVWRPGLGRIERLRVAVSCAAMLLDRGRRVCARGGDPFARRAVLGSFARYAKGHGCSWSGARDRYRTFERVRGALVDFMAGIQPPWLASGEGL